MYFTTYRKIVKKYSDETPYTYAEVVEIVPYRRVKTWVAEELINYLDTELLYVCC